MTEFKIEVTQDQFDRLRKWATVLSTYEKTEKILRTATCFCCLGVACEVSSLSDWEVREDGLGKEFRYFNHEGILPLDVQRWYGFSCTRGFQIPKHIVELFFNKDVEDDWITLADINDTFEYTTHQEMSQFILFLLDNYTEILVQENCYPSHLIYFSEISHGE